METLFLLLPLPMLPHGICQNPLTRACGSKGCVQAHAQSSETRDSSGGEPWSSRRLPGRCWKWGGQGQGGGAIQALLSHCLLSTLGLVRENRTLPPPATAAAVSLYFLILTLFVPRTLPNFSSSLCSPLFIFLFPHQPK